MPVVVVSYNKGGTGKTTIAEMLIQHSHYKEITILDLDMNQNKSKKDGVPCPRFSNEEIESGLRALIFDKSTLAVVDCGGEINDGIVTAVKNANLILTPIIPSNNDLANIDDYSKKLTLIEQSTGVKTESHVVFTDVSPSYERHHLQPYIDRVKAMPNMHYTGIVIPHSDHFRNGKTKLTNRAIARINQLVQFVEEGIQ